VKWLLAVAMAVAITLSVLGCIEQEGTGENTTAVSVIVSIYPIGDMVKQVGGERVDVVVLLPPGADPHTWEPTPQQIKVFERADLFVETGTGLEFWADDFVKETGVRVLTFTKDYQPGRNPHVWLDPVFAEDFVVRLKDTLSDIDPEGKGYYEKRTQDYLLQLQQLDMEYRETLENVSNRVFVSTHPTWEYICMRYNLTEIPIEETPEKEITPARLREVIEMARRLDARVVFVEPQQNPQLAQAVANELGVEVLTLDPLGDPKDPQRDTYIKLMEYNLAQLKKGLGGKYEDH